MRVSRLQLSGDRKMRSKSASNVHAEQQLNSIIAVECHVIDGKTTDHLSRVEVDEVKIRETSHTGVT